MARLSDKKVEEREKKVYALFSLEEEPSVADVQQVLKSDGGTMNPSRIYAIRAAALAGNPIPPRVDYSKAAIALRKLKSGPQDAGVK